MDRGPQPADRSAGFMLVEVVIALAITALAFGFAFRALSGASERLRKDQNSTKALLLAESTLDRVGHDIGFASPPRSGETKDGFSWVVQTAPYDGDLAAESAPLMGYVVRVTVRWKEQGSPRQVQLTTLRLAARSGSS